MPLGEMELEVLKYIENIYLHSTLRPTVTKLHTTSLQYGNFNILTLYSHVVFINDYS